VLARWIAALRNSLQAAVVRVFLALAIGIEGAVSRKPRQAVRNSL